MSLKDRLRESGREISIARVADEGYHTIQWWSEVRMVTDQAVRLWIDRGEFKAALCEGRIFCKPKEKEEK